MIKIDQDMLTKLTKNKSLVIFVAIVIIALLWSWLGT
jgi:hypothetical protein